ncbi:MAG: serine/threonine protein kinase [Kaiparowitsia implicata GSE-PSE-MK54-09C]|jgi:serine/threonine protein kinase|nr:serine/threonine protein kinase [Kaiparowitsia implicata GSE-PSE-MK54-09C]
MNFCQSCGSRLRLGDRYAAFQPLGSGNSSRTFLGMDTTQLLDPRCIIKRYSTSEAEASLHPDLPGSLSDADRLRHDIAKLAELSDHPQLPDVLAYFERGAQQFLVQQFVDGSSLLQQLQQHGTFDEPQIRAVLRSLLTVLHYLHQHHVIHRDVKPANAIALSSQRPADSWMLVDFGAVKFATQSALAKTGTVMGSAEYAAPEQLMGKATFASDLYGLGTTCLQLVTGLSPFDLFDTANGQWYWRSVAGDIGDDLARILDRLVAMPLGDRYATAAAVLQDLGASPTQIRLSASWQALQWKTTAVQTGSQTGHWSGCQSGDPSTANPWRCIHTLALGHAVQAIAPLPQENLLLVAGSASPSPAGASPSPKAQQGCSLNLWDVDRDEMRWQFVGHDYSITSLAVSADGVQFASGSDDRTVRLWDVKSGQTIRVLEGHGDRITALALDGAGQRLVSASRDKTLRLWDTLSGKLLHTFTGHPQSIEAIALHPDRNLLLSGDAGGTLKLWHLGTQELLRTLPSHTARVSAVALTPDGQTAVSASWDVTVKLRQVQTGALRHTLTGHTLPIGAIALHPNGTVLATASPDRQVNLWDLTTATLSGTFVLPDDTAKGGAIAPPRLAFFANGTLVSASASGTLHQWRQT